MFIKKYSIHFQTLLHKFSSYNCIVTAKRYYILISSQCRRILPCHVNIQYWKCYFFLSFFFLLKPFRINAHEINIMNLLSKIEFDSLEDKATTATIHFHFCGCSCRTNSWIRLLINKFDARSPKSWHVSFQIEKKTENDQDRSIIFKQNSSMNMLYREKRNAVYGSNYTI